MPRVPLLLAAVLAASCTAAGPRRSGAVPATAAPERPGRSGASTSAQAPESTAAASRDAGEADMARLVNEHRRAAGCDTLVWDDRLAAVARAHSASMRADGYFAHEDPEGRDVFMRVQAAGIRGWRIVAENIALTPRPPDAVLRLWLASPGHRANLENCALTRHGVGRVEGFWTHVFTG